VLRGGQGFGLGFEDGEDFDEMGELEHLARAALEAEEGEAGFKLAGYLETFDERGYAGAIDVFHLREIDDEARGFLVLQLLDEHRAELRRVVESDIAGYVDDCCFAGLSNGKIHEARFCLVVALAGETAEGAPPLGLFQNHFCRLDNGADRVANFQFHFLSAAARDHTFDNHFTRADDHVRHDVADMNFLDFADDAVTR